MRQMCHIGVIGTLFHYSCTLVGNKPLLHAQNNSDGNVCENNHAYRKSMLSDASNLHGEKNSTTYSVHY